MENEDRGGIGRQLQHDNATIAFGRVVPYVCKAKVTGQETELAVLSVTGDNWVFRTAETDISDVYSLMAEFF